jgi:tRNA threonylcarbamoyladenosine biosynthesis protein TsaB
MDEVYWGCFERSGDAVFALGPEAVGAPGQVALPPAWDAAQALGAGSGFAAYTQRLAALASQLAVVYCELRPRAREIALLAAQDGLASALPPEQAQPVYLRDDVARPASPN